MKLHLVLWWMGGGRECPTCGHKRDAPAPYAALFENEVGTEAAAAVRNALVVSLSGKDIHIDAVSDYYRRDEAGKPMPAEWRDLVGQVRMPWAKGEAV